jgi:hypothetical protein
MHFIMHSGANWTATWPAGRGIGKATATGCSRSSAWPRGNPLVSGATTDVEPGYGPNAVVAIDTLLRCAQRTPSPITLDDMAAARGDRRGLPVGRRRRDAICRPDWADVTQPLWGAIPEST